ncbi:DoxX family protein [Pedobacter sp. B4-66]|uniref:DoxX family protein n=1 Tax=Pedobacter sp. B4-66 TaxID=2817280 RepID=UPI001BDB1204|nr:DoxX family protein [Pedobacter sp. B4-66]
MSFFNTNNSQWSGKEKIVLRFFILYFIIQVVPLDWKFYRDLFSINPVEFSFYDLFKLTKYAPQFFSLTGYANWGVAAVLAAIGTLIWGNLKREFDYNSLYYGLRVILRYRLAIGIIAYGFIKLFPLQMPYPSLSNLHTNYGDFFAWKIYFHTVGIAQPYEVFLGFVEILAGLLLFFRRTATFGSGLILGFIGNVVVANIAYDAGEQVYSLYLVVIALFLFVYDVPRLYSLLALERQTIANKFTPIFVTKGIRNLRIVLKTAFAAFVILLGGATYANYSKAPYKIPRSKGLAGTYGYYNVREFRFNNQLIPYSTTDPNRWQNVVFEKWATISIKIARPIKLDPSTGDGYFANDIDRNYESAGVGGRQYFAYTSDTVNKKIVLRNKNKNYSGEGFTLQYKQLNDSTIVLTGLNEKRDSISAILDKINRKYMLFEGRRKPVKL